MVVEDTNLIPTDDQGLTGRVFQLWVGSGSGIGKNYQFGSGLGLGSGIGNISNQSGSIGY